jgi:hypothetical protein
MITLENGVKTFLVVFLGTAMAFFVMGTQNNKISQRVFSSSLPAVITPSPTETYFDSLKESVMDSPEGSKTLILQKQTIKGIVTYSLFVTSKSDGQKLQILKKVEASTNGLLIPFNSWSPDNVYFFLKETTPVGDDYLVFQTSGDFFSNNSPYISIQELFKSKVPNHIIEDVTGWGGLNLILINAKSVEQNNKVSFWLDVPSQTFIQLGTYFK